MTNPRRVEVSCADRPLFVCAILTDGISFDEATGEFNIAGGYVLLRSPSFRSCTASVEGETMRLVFIDISEAMDFVDWLYGANASAYELSTRMLD